VTRVLVAASSAVTRAGLETILAREPAFTVVGRGGLTTLTEDVAEHEPDVVLVELGAGGDEDTLTMLHALGVDADDGARSVPALVLLTDERDPAYAIEALRAGVRSLLPRDAGSAEIAAAVSAAAAGLVAVAHEWTDAMRAALGVDRAASNGAGGEGLTAREVEVLRLIAEGLGNKQIAARLAISEHTVKFHVASVFGKIRASTRAEAVMIGARRGLIVL
jgi:two-component system, NarL family, response regulator YdfI